MPRNSSGTYTLPAGNPVVSGTLIETTWANPTMSDIGTAITDSLDRFGRGGMLAPMRFVDGTLTAPAMAFSSETTMGLYRPSSGVLAAVIGGAALWSLSAASLAITPPTTFAGNVTVNGTLTLAGAITIPGALTVTGATTLQTTTVMGSSAAIPANTRTYIDAVGTSVLPTLTAGSTVLTVANSAAAGSSALIQVISGNTGNASIVFGDTDAATRGSVGYSNSTELLAFVAAGATGLTLDGSGNLQPVGTLTLPSGTAALPSLRFAASTTTGLFRQAADAIGFATAGVERWRVDSSGRWLSSATAAQATRIGSTGVTPQLQVTSTGTSGSAYSTYTWAAAAGTSGTYFFGKSRGAAIGTQTIVQSGDTLGRISAAGSDGVQFTEAARIQFSVDGTPGVDDMPGRIEFMTTPDGGLTPVLALTLANDGAATFAAGATLAGVLAGTTATFVSTTAAPQILINRTSAAVNTAIAFQNTSGTVYAGHGAANTFAVGNSANLSSAAYLTTTSTLLTFAGFGRFNGATQGNFGVAEGAGSGATVNTSADTIVIDGDASCGLSILTPNTAIGLIYFGDPQSASQGRINYTHSTDTLGIYANNALCLSVTDILVTMGGACELVIDPVGPTSVNSAGFRGLPQNSRSAAYTLVLGDAGKQIYHPSADTTARVWTIPANSSVAFPIGTAVTFINDNAAGTLTIAITTDTLVMAPGGTTGSRTLAANGIATAVKVTATRWQISGTNLS